MFNSPDADYVYVARAAGAASMGRFMSATSNSARCSRTCRTGRKLSRYCGSPTTRSASRRRQVHAMPDAYLSLTEALRHRYQQPRPGADRMGQRRGA